MLSTAIRYFPDDPTILLDGTRCPRCTIIYGDDIPEDHAFGVCFLCAGDLRKLGAKPMNVMTHEKKIKVHTLQLDDHEVERFLDNPEELTDLLRDLLVSKPTGDDNGDRPSRKKVARKPRAIAGAIIPCKFCGREISYRQIKRHENTCTQNPNFGHAGAPE
jgi:hypothetical protein